MMLLLMELRKLFYLFKKIIREYIVGILTEKYVVNDGGAYADTPEQKRIKNETLEAKIKFLDESLDNLLV